MAISEINKLQVLDPRKQLTFAYLACKRILPNYVFFSANYKFGDISVMKDAISFVYDSIFIFPDIDQIKMVKTLPLIYANIPHTNNFTTYNATIAMYCGVVICESVNLINQRDTDRILKDISTAVTDAIDCFIQVRDDMDYKDVNFEQKILDDPIMQNELNLQKSIISNLQIISSIETNDVDTLLNLQAENLKLWIPGA